MWAVLISFSAPIGVGLASLYSAGSQREDVLRGAGFGDETGRWLAFGKVEFHSKTAALARFRRGTHDAAHAFDQLAG
jgi:hypothetical protein